MADIKQALNNGASATITIDNLGNSAGRGSNAIDNSAGLYLSADVRVKIKTNAAGTSASGYVAVYLIRSDDGTNFDDAFAGNDGAYTPVNAFLLGTISAVANATSYVKVFDTNELGLTLPAKWCIGVYNASGAALDNAGGNNAITYREKYLTVI